VDAAENLGFYALGSKNFGLDQHAPQKAEVATSGELGSKLASPAQMLFAEKIARERGIVIPDETKASSAAVSAWIASNLSTERRQGPSQD
jgi:DNA topoisomerase III